MSKISLIYYGIYNYYGIATLILTWTFVVVDEITHYKLYIKDYKGYTLFDNHRFQDLDRYNLESIECLLAKIPKEHTVAKFIERKCQNRIIR
jgi:hypothetical protein